MSAQQNQLKDLNEEDYHAFISLYSYTPVGNITHSPLIHPSIQLHPCG